MAKRAKKTAKRGRKSTAKAEATRGGASLSNMSVGELQMELARRKRGAAKLERRRDKLVAELAEINAQLAGSGVVGSGGGRRNSMTLPDALYNVLQGRTMSVTEAADAVRASGYTSAAANFRTMVNQALLKDKRFKKVARGEYSAS